MTKRSRALKLGDIESSVDNNDNLSFKCWCQLQMDDTMKRFGQPVLLRLQDSRVIVESIKDALRAKLPNILREVDNVQLQVFSYDASMLLNVDDVWDSKIHGGNTASRSLVVKFLIPPTLYGKACVDTSDESSSHQTKRTRQSLSTQTLQSPPTGENKLNSMVAEGTSKKILQRLQAEELSKAPRVSDASLDPVSGSLKCRLQHNETFHWPTPRQRPKSKCSLHYWAARIADRSQIVRCSICKVHLCTACFEKFHVVPDIVLRKDELAEEMRGKHLRDSYSKMKQSKSPENYF